MSRVFLGEDLALGRRVVVKGLPPDLAAGVTFDRLKKEILAPAGLQPRNFVPVFAAGETSGLPYYTMPFVEGESLRVRLLRTGAMPLLVAVSILRDVARALEFAHSKGVVHRDIKPDNILLTGNTATVSDFGIAKALIASRVATSSEAMTERGVAIGTPQYMAPEQAAADASMDHRVDLYALGCVAYEMIAGEPPFVGRTPASLLLAHIVEAPTPIATKRADVPEALGALIARCLEKDPVGRPASAHEIIEVLDNLASVQAPGSRSTGSTELAPIAVLPLASGPGPRYLLNGTLRRAGSRLRVTAQLVDAKADAPLWADKFNGTLEDVFDIQERLSRQIVDALRLRLTPNEDKRLAQHPLADVRAYEYYLLARQEIWTFNAQSLDHALQLVRRAQDIVGDNELLLVAEGLIYWQQVNVGMVPVSQYDECLRRAEASAAQVVALNPESSKGHSLRGAIRHTRADPDGAARDYKRALLLDPNDPEALLWLAYSYGVSGRPALAREHLDRLKQLDPLRSVNIIMSGSDYNYY